MDGASSSFDMNGSMYWSGELMECMLSIRDTCRINRDNSFSSIENCSAMSGICRGTFSSRATRYVHAAATPAMERPVTYPLSERRLYNRATSSCNAVGSCERSRMNWLAFTRFLSRDLRVFERSSMILLRRHSLRLWLEMPCRLAAPVFKSRTSMVVFRPRSARV